jgi:hypothetical protein
MSQTLTRRALGLVASAIAGIAIGLTVGAQDHPPSIALKPADLLAGPVAALTPGDDVRDSLNAEVAPADTPFAVDEMRSTIKPSSGKQPRGRVG